MLNKSYNKGEWSEVYVFLKILGDGKLYAGNNKGEEFYPILKIINEDLDLDYKIIHMDEIDFKADYVYIEDKINKTSEKLESSILKDVYKILYEKIINGKGRSFEISEISKQLEELKIESIKSGSNKKSDIILKIKDLKILQNKILEFSIKSFLGNSPTILNSSNNTNFRYKIKNIRYEDKVKIEEINKNNSRTWLKDRINYIKTNYDIEFDGMVSPIYENNFRFIDSNLDLIVADLLLEFYSTKSLSSIKDLIKKISENNILEIKDNIEEFYKSKVISLIKASSFGMMPNIIWDGKYEVDGGMIIVFRSGDTRMYHLYYDDTYLDDIFYKKTKLETPSSTRYEMGKIYMENNNYYFNLNLQIRYK